MWIYSSMLKKAEESSIQYSRRVDAAVCVRARASDVCAENFSHNARLQQSRAFYMLALCLQAVLISSPDTWDWTRMHALVVMHRRTFCENLDSAKIKVISISISIFYMWHCHTLYRYIDPHRCIVTPLIYTHTYTYIYIYIYRNFRNQYFYLARML